MLDEEETKPLIEGDTLGLTCSACGKPWMECAERREAWFFCDIESAETMDILEVKAWLREEHGVCPGGKPEGKGEG